LNLKLVLIYKNLLTKKRTQVKMKFTMDLLNEYRMGLTITCALLVIYN